MHHADCDYGYRNGWTLFDLVCELRIDQQREKIKQRLYLILKSHGNTQIQLWKIFKIFMYFHDTKKFDEYYSYILKKCPFYILIHLFIGISICQTTYFD